MQTVIPVNTPYFLNLAVQKLMKENIPDSSMKRFDFSCLYCGSLLNTEMASFTREKTGQVFLQA